MMKLNPQISSQWLWLFIGIYIALIGLRTIFLGAGDFLLHGFDGLRFVSEVLMPTIFFLFGLFLSLKSIRGIHRAKNAIPDTKKDTLSSIVKVFGVLAGIGLWLLLIPAIYVLIIIYNWR